MNWLAGRSSQGRNSKAPPSIRLCNIAQDDVNSCRWWDFCMERCSAFQKFVGRAWLSPSHDLYVVSLVPIPDALLGSPKTNWQISKETKSWNRHAWGSCTLDGNNGEDHSKSKSEPGFLTWTYSAYIRKPQAPVILTSLIRQRLSKSLGCRFQCASQGAVYQRRLSQWHVISADHWITPICRSKI